MWEEHLRVFPVEAVEQSRALAEVARIGYRHEYEGTLEEVLSRYEESEGRQLFSLDKNSVIELVRGLVRLSDFAPLTVHAFRIEPPNDTYVLEVAQRYASVSRYAMRRVGLIWGVPVASAELELALDVLRRVWPVLRMLIVRAKAWECVVEAQGRGVLLAGHILTERERATFYPLKRVNAGHTIMYVLSTTRSFVPALPGVYVRSRGEMLKACDW